MVVSAHYAIYKFAQCNVRKFSRIRRVDDLTSRRRTDRRELCKCQSTIYVEIKSQFYGYIENCEQTFDIY